MTNDFLTDNPELEALYQKYEKAPDSHVFAPLADAYRKAGMLEEARAICDKGVEKHPQYTSGYVVQGKCYFDLKRPEKAERAFRKVLELDRNNLVALKYIGLILLDRGEKDGAMEHFEHILKLDPDNKEIKFKLEDLAEEVTQLRTVVDKDFEGAPISLGDEDETSDDLATTTLADIYAEQGYTDKAEKIYCEILKKQPDNEHVINKLKALAGGGFTRLETPEDVEKENKNATIEAVVEDVWEGEQTSQEKDRAEDEPPAAEIEAEEEAPPAAQIKAEEKARPAPAKKTPGAKDKTPERPAIKDGKSYDQFKRWLKNMSE